MPWVVSGRSAPALRGQAGRLAAFARDGLGDAEVADAGYRLATGRAVFDDRAVVLASEADGFAAGLAAVAAGDPAANVVTGTTGPAGGGRLAFVFAGQGSQRPGMGAGLAARFGVFAEAIDEACGHLDPLLSRPVREVIWAPYGSAAAGLGDQTVFTQAGLFVTGVALARLLESWGITPDLVAGHSIGEITAAYLAGVMSLADACTLVAARAQGMQELAGGGAMIAIGATEDGVAGSLPEGGDAVIAAVNGPTSVVVSGQRAAVMDVGRQWRSQGTRVRVLRVSHAFHSPLTEPMLAAFGAVASGLTLADPLIPAASSVTGQVAEAGQLSQAAYWVDQVRQPVRFGDCARALAGRGAGTFVELGPDGALSVLGSDSTAVESGDGPVWVPARRPGQPEDTALLTAAARLFVRGVEVDWTPVFGLERPRWVDLPTYAFQRQRYWPSQVARAKRGPAGLGATGHPLLDSVVQLADGDGAVFTGHLSVRAFPWLADHALLQTVLVPGTAFVDLVGWVGQRAGCPELEELTLEAPLVVPERGGRQLQVRVSGPDSDGRREVSVHSRAESGDGVADPAADWTRHASGTLVQPTVDAEAGLGLAAWPPPQAEALPVEGHYTLLEQHGYGYGPAFRGLVAAWRRDGEVFAEARLPEGSAHDAGAFGVHPALLDAALHAVGLAAGADAVGAGDGAAQGAGQGMLPFSWAGVRVEGGGPTMLRVRMSLGSEGGLRLVAADESGRPVVRVDSLVLRPVSADQLRTARAGAQRALFGVDWAQIATPPEAESAGGAWAVLAGPDAQPVAAGLGEAGVSVSEQASIQDLAAAATAGEPVPEAVAVLLPAGSPGPDGVRQAVHETLELVQAWLAEDALAGSVLVMITQGAAAAADDDGQGLDLARAAASGLIRSAQSENPGRLVLADVDGQEASWQALAAVPGSEEPEVAIRGGVLHGRRLVRAPAVGRVSGQESGAVGRVSGQESGAGAGEPWRPDPEGTVLVTGGTGTLGGQVAAHLARAHNSRHLLLASRSGPGAAGAAGLAAELAGHGARVTVAACDAGDRARLAGLLARVPAGHPLTAVVHTAGVLDDGVISALTPQRVSTVLRPKADAAAHLDELTEGMDLSAFVLFSSAAATFGAPGQGNYAAANAYLDALAARRRARGLPAVSVAWGLWEQQTGMTARLGQPELRRIGGLMTAMPTKQGLDLLDASVGSDRPLAVAVNLSLAALRAQAGTGMLPPIYQALAPVSARSAGRAPAGETLRGKLAGLTVTEQAQAVLNLVRAQAAAALGHASAEAIPPEAAFRDLGFDSLTAVELRNRLNMVTGLRLPATLVFDYPTSEVLTDYLCAEIGQDSPAAPAVPPALSELEKLEAMLSTETAAEGIEPERITARLEAVLAKWKASLNKESGATENELMAATTENIFDLIDEEFGTREIDK
jgi:malonyl CoA-acyl carrier protein transacylase/acyl carrier protein